MATLPPLAAVADLEARLGLVAGSLAGGDLARASAVLQDVSSLVRQEARTPWLAVDGITLTVPDAVVTVVLQVALRWYKNPDGFLLESIGDYSYRLDRGEFGQYLTTVEKAIIRREAGKTAHGFGTMRIPSSYGPVDYTTADVLAFFDGTLIGDLTEDGFEDDFFGGIQ